MHGTSRDTYQLDVGRERHFGIAKFDLIRISQPAALDTKCAAERPILVRNQLDGFRQAHQLGHQLARRGLAVGDAYNARDATCLELR